MLAIYKKELRQYFNSMIGFVFLAFFLVIIGIYTWAYNFSGGLGNFEVTLGGKKKTGNVKFVNKKEGFAIISLIVYSVTEYFFPS